MRKGMRLSDKYKNETEADILKEAVDNQSCFYDEYQFNIMNGMKMRNFLYADEGQWYGTEITDRRLRSKTYDQINVIEPIVRKIIAENRSADSQAIVTPTDSNLPTEIVNLKSDLLEQIAYESCSQTVFGNVFADMIDIGFSVAEVVSEPESECSFNNVLRFKNIPEALYSYFDTFAKHPNKIDGDFCGYFFPMSKFSAELMYDDDTIQSVGYPGIMFNDYRFNSRKETIVLAKHYRRVHGTIEMIKLEDGAEMPKSAYISVKKEILQSYRRAEEAYNAKIQQTIELGKLKGMQDEQIAQAIANLDKPSQPYIPEIAKTKRCKTSYVEALILSKYKILKRDILPVKDMPLFYIGAYDKMVRGRTTCQPFAANAVAPQRLLNYVTCEQMDNIGRSFGSRVIALDEAIVGEEQQYARPSISNLLKYKRSSTGDLVRPDIVVESGVDVNLLQVQNQCMEAIKAVTGRYNDNLGEESNAYGKEAILQRQMNGDIANSLYAENLNYAIAEINKVALDWMPFVYDTERSILVRDKEGQTRFVTINRPTGDTDEIGNTVFENDIRLGSFGVQVYGGSSFMSQRMAGMQFIDRFMQQDPNLMHILGDIYIKLSPFTFKNEAINRLKASGYIDPAITAEEEGKAPPPSKPDPVQELAKLKVIEQITSMKQQAEMHKIDLIGKVVDLKEKQAQNKAEIDKSIMELIGSTAEALEKGVQAQAEAENAQIDRINDDVDRILDDELKYAQSLKLTAGDKNGRTE